MSVDWIGYGYAALVASGGIAGYVKAGIVSIPLCFLQLSSSVSLLAQ